MLAESLKQSEENQMNKSWKKKFLTIYLGIPPSWGRDPALKKKNKQPRAENKILHCCDLLAPSSPALLLKKKRGEKGEKKSLSIVTYWPLPLPPSRYSPAVYDRLHHWLDPMLTTQGYSLHLCILVGNPSQKDHQLETLQRKTKGVIYKIQKIEWGNLRIWDQLFQRTSLTWSYEVPCKFCVPWQ